jgi:hypothetical protein
MKIYLAGPLFSEAERDWMSKLKGQIESLAAEFGWKKKVEVSLNSRLLSRLALVLLLLFVGFFPMIYY